MIDITLDLDTGLAKLAAATVIKAGGGVPVRITLSRDPGGAIDFQLALGPQSSTPAVLAYLDIFQGENSMTFMGILDATDTRLATYMVGKQTATLDCELAWRQDGQWQVAPNFSLTVQPRMVAGPENSQGGPVYLLDSNLSGFSGALIVGDKTLTLQNGLIKSIA